MPGSSELAAALAANEAFYKAFASRDHAAMERLWAREASVTSIHPGWGPLYGRKAVMDSWAGILANPAAPKIKCLGAKAILHGGVAVVLCYEEIELDLLVATNLFIKEGDTWKLVHHQAGPTVARPEGSPGKVPRRLH
jgi:ketosteroid isomerase-like protein